MKNASVAFKNELNNGNRRYVKTARITFSDGNNITLSNSDMWGNGLKIITSVSGANSFDVGSVIIGQLTITLNNIEEKFSSYDFSGAIIDNINIGLELPDGTIEYLTYGVFTVNETKYNGSVITISAYDNLYKFDRLYSESTLDYPASLNEIVRDACSVCEVTLQSLEFPNDDFVVNEKPDDSAITFRNILQWACQISCTFCVADEQGRLALKWYDTEALEKLYKLDGGTFEPWTNNDIVSGGFFNPWVKNNIIDGGSFSDLDLIHHIYSWNSLSLSIDDVVVTGVKVSDEIDGENGLETISSLSGSEGYVLEISGNKLIQGNTTSVSNFVGSRVIGMRFRPFSGTTLSNPMIEPGDIAILSDQKGNSYNTVITSNTFQPGSFQPISCGAVPAVRNSAQRFSEATQAYVNARKEINKEKSEREKAISDLNTKLENSPGLYTTTETVSGGGSIFYLHDKPKLSDSMIVWKMTAEAWGVSTDGGKTYNAGMTVDGDTIVRILSAVGVNADWIKTGTMSFDRSRGGTLALGGNNNGNGVLIIYNASGTQIGRWDKDGITATNANISGVINANEGKIGEWYLTSGSLTNGLPYTGAGNSNSTGMGTYGNAGWAFWAGNGRFSVTQSGNVHAENADISGIVNASSGVFDNVTVRNSNVTNSSLSGSAGTISGGTYSSPYISGGSVASTGGTYVGNCSGSSFSACSLGGTSLSTGNGTAYMSNNGSGNIYLYGQNGAYLYGNSVFLDGSISLAGNTRINGGLTVIGDKNRLMHTDHYGNRLVSAYETPEPTFSDYGTGQIDETGNCYITIDPIFSEIVLDKCPVVFLTKYGQGDIYYEPEESSFLVVHICGTPGLKFAWETRFHQKNSRERLSEYEIGLIDNNFPDFDFEGNADYEYQKKDYGNYGYEDYIYYIFTCIDYGYEGDKYYEEFERSISND